jgi:hypothetical protein
VIADYDEASGWPAEATPVHHDPTPLLGRLPRMATRLCALDRHARYRHRRGNERRRELYRAAKEAAK